MVREKSKLLNTSHFALSFPEVATAGSRVNTRQCLELSCMNKNGFPCHYLSRE